MSEIKCIILFSLIELCGTAYSHFTRSIVCSLDQYHDIAMEGLVNTVLAI